MGICSTRIEPLPHSTFDVPQRLRAALEEIKVLIFADDFADQRRAADGAPRFWFLNLPEQPFVNGEWWRLQGGQQWQQTNDGRWFFEDMAVRNLDGAWGLDPETNVEVLLPFSDDERPVRARQSATIWADENGVHYTLTVRNTSDEPLTDLHQWICFNSYMSPETGFRPYVRMGDDWRPIQDIDKTILHCYLPTSEYVEEYKRCKMSADNLRHTPTSFPGVIAWNYVHNHQPLLTCHYSKQAVSVGSNQGWPCTDLCMWFGTLTPGEEKTCRGHIVIANEELSEFTDKLDSTAATWDRIDSCHH